MLKYAQKVYSRTVGCQKRAKFSLRSFWKPPYTDFCLQFFFFVVKIMISFTFSRGSMLSFFNGRPNQLLNWQNNINLLSQSTDAFNFENVNKICVGIKKMYPGHFELLMDLGNLKM